MEHQLWLLNGGENAPKRSDGDIKVVQRLVSAVLCRASVDFSRIFLLFRSAVRIPGFVTYLETFCSLLASTVDVCGREITENQHPTSSYFPNR